MEARILSSWTVGLVLTTCSGCAAMFDGTKSEVMFTSEPTGMKVVAGSASGVTPVSLEVAKSQKSAEFIAPDGTRSEVDLERSFQAGFLLMDLLFTPGFGLSGLLIDGPTSAYYKHKGLVHFDASRPTPVAAAVTGDEVAQTTIRRPEHDRAFD